jgi:hypothetical protein
MQTVLEPQIAKIALLENGTTKLGKTQQIHVRIVGRVNGPRVQQKHQKLLALAVLLQNIQLQMVLPQKVLA